MGLLIGSILTLIILVLFFKFPKQMFILLVLLIMAILFIWYFSEKIPSDKEKKMKYDIKITLIYDVASCGSEYPLFVEIVNNSNSTIKKISWDLDIFKPGFSTDLSGYNDYNCDKILKPGEKWSTCYSLPKSIQTEGYNLSALRYEIGYKHIETEEQ